MPPKVTLDKLCWKWAETTDPSCITREHVRTSYRLELPKCKLGACRRQCKGNPYCLNCIGEKVWFGEIQDTTWHDIQDPEDERRQPGTFVGLKNLGATCYVNTFLQLWFHNEKVKRGIYQWRPIEKPDETEWKPSSVCSHLQVIFGMLENTKRQYIDPSDFIQHLGLDAGQQQDAQEFSKLFLTVLEENLLQNNMPNPRNVIKEQFCGSYAYVTRCSNCNSASERLSEFYELDLNIQGHKTLENSLKGFLGVEKLEGDNKYMCNTCNSKQNASRAIELKTLPPVLNLQLLRFVFEIKTGSKKKLSSIIQFPDVLDMSVFLHAGETAVYDLSAVLIHRGPSAYSGHYVAHIKGKDSQAWYKFNDEEVEKIKGRNLQLGNEEDLEINQKKTAARTPKGYHSSKNAYMLVYTRRSDTKAAEGHDNNHSVTQCEPPSDQKNGRLESQFIENKKVHTSMQIPKYNNYNSFNATMFTNQQLIKNFYESLRCGENQNGAMTAYRMAMYSQMLYERNEAIASSASEMYAHCVGHNPIMASMSAPSLHVPSVVSPPPQTQAAQDIPKSTSVETVNGKNDNKSKDTNSSTLLPSYVLDFVEKDNETFENWVLEMNDMKSKNIATGKEKQETVKSIFQDLVLGDSSDLDSYEWLPMSWLSKWLNDPNAAPAIDVVPFMCSHGKLCPDQSVKMKCVSQNGSNQLFNIYGGDVRMSGETTLCEQCVRNKCMSIRTKQDISEDDKFITKEMKTSLIGKICYWIGKASFRSWRRLALERLIGPADEGSEGPQPSGSSSDSVPSSESTLLSNDSNVDSDQGTEIKQSDKEMNVTVGSTTEIACCEGKNGEDSREEKDSDDKDTEGETVLFNEDLLCEAHRGLDPDVSCRRPVPESVWFRLKKYFPNCPEFDYGTVSCEECQSSRDQENEMKRMNKQIAAQQKTNLPDLFYDRKRPLRIPESSCVYIVSTNFISQWRQFVRDPVRYEPVCSINNNVLLCKHGGYLYLTAAEMLKSDENVTYVYPEEWVKLKDMYSVDCEIKVMSGVLGDKQGIQTEPAVCQGCLEYRLNMQEKEIFDYNNATIYIRKHQKLEAEANNQLTKDKPQSDDSEGDTKLNPSGNKRSLPDDAVSSEPIEKAAKISEDSRNVRKSQRHRRVRGEKELNVSSDSTLKDLKVQIMKLFTVPPFDQNLYVNGIKVTADNSSTLSELRIAPGTVIDLVADEFEGDPVLFEELHKESGLPESGFKGTNLLSS